MSLAPMWCVFGHDGDAEGHPLNRLAKFVFICAQDCCQVSIKSDYLCIEVNFARTRHRTKHPIALIDANQPRAILFTERVDRYKHDVNTLFPGSRLTIHRNIDPIRKLVHGAR